MAKTLNEELESFKGREDSLAGELVYMLKNDYPEATEEDLINAFAVALDIYSRAVNQILNSNKEET